MAIEWRIACDIRPKSSSRRDEAIAALAARQQGLVSRAQLLDLGIGADAIKHRVRVGRLHPLRRGVYAVGHRALRSEAPWMAAVLAGGPGTVVAGRSGAELWRIRAGGRAVVEVICPRRLDLPGIEAHRVVLPEDEVTVERGIPVTTPARTLLDLAAVVSEEHLKAAFDEAEYRRLTSPTSLDALLARYPGRRGTRALRRILDKHAHKPIPTSILERRFLSLLDAHDLPRPQINRLSDQGELDATWPEQRLIVECDGFATHGTRDAFERDRARDRELVVAGWRVIRITWRQLDDEPGTIAKQLAALLRD